MSREWSKSDCYRKLSLPEMTVYINSQAVSVELLGTKTEQCNAVAKRLEHFLEKHETKKSVSIEEVIGPVKLAIQLLQSGADIKKDSEEIVNLDEGVPDEVRSWLLSTFSESCHSNKKSQSSNRRGLKGIATGISAAIRMERIMGNKKDVFFPDGLQDNIKRMDCWDWNIHKANQIANGKILRYVIHETFAMNGLLSAFQISSQKLMDFGSKIESLYDANENAYHNSIHAADVCQSLNYIFRQNCVMNWLDDLEIMAALFAAIIHDVSHTGFTNNYHIKTKSELAILYNDQSVLENHHLATAFNVLLDEKYDIAACFNETQWDDFRSIVIQMVLGTDMTNHYKHLTEITEQTADPTRLDRIQVLTFILHACDICHPVKSWDIHAEFCELLFKEFFNQGDIEREKGLPISPLCDRNTLHKPQSQITFGKYIVLPTFEAVTDILKVTANEILKANQDESRAQGLTRAKSQKQTRRSSLAGNEISEMESGLDSTPKSFKLRRHCRLSDLPLRIQKFSETWNKNLSKNSQKWTVYSLNKDI